jgi:hypothetical protein
LLTARGRRTIVAACATRCDLWIASFAVLMVGAAVVKWLVRPRPARMTTQSP